MRAFFRPSRKVHLTIGVKRTTLISMASPTTQTNTAPLAAMENQTMEVENSGKIAANIRQLIAELERQIKEQSHENTTEFRIVITHEGAQVSQITSGPEYLRAKGLTALNLRGEKIA